MCDLVERLRGVQSIRRDTTPLSVAVALCSEAADEITRLRAEVEALREALKTAQYRSMVDARISYKGYSYGMRSMDGIRDLRLAIERDKNY